MTTQQTALAREMVSEALENNFYLITLSLRVWQGRVHDAAAGAELDQKHGAAPGSYKAMKELFPVENAELSAAKSAYNALRTYVYADTVPWTSNESGARRGPRLKPVTNIMEFLRGWKVKAQYAVEKKEAFKEVYERTRDKSIADLGDGGDPTDYPPVEVIDDMFYFNLTWDPVPTTGAMQNVQVTDVLSQHLITKMEERQNVTLQIAMNDVKDRVVKELTRIAKQLGEYAEYDPEQSERKRAPSLYKTLLTNIDGLTDLLRSLNMTDDDEVTRVCDEITKKICAYELDTVKASVSLPATMARDAETLAEAVDALELF